MSSQCEPHKIMKNINLNELVENSELELTTISTTSTYNGYPANVKPAIIGFDNFEEAEKFAKAHHLDIIRVERANGSDLWTRRGTAYKELERDGSEFGDDWTVYNPLSFDAQEFFADTVKDVVTDMETLDDAIECLNEFKELINAINNADDDELVLVNNGQIETIETHCMRYSYDSRTYAIAVVQP